MALVIDKGVYRQLVIDKKAFLSSDVLNGAGNAGAAGALSLRVGGRSANPWR